MQTSPADLQVTHYLERGQGGDAPPAMQLQASMGPPRLDSDHSGEPCLGEGRGLPLAVWDGLCMMLLGLLASPHMCSGIGSVSNSGGRSRGAASDRSIGAPCCTPLPPAVLDCLFNSELLARCADYRTLKMFLIQLALGKSEQQVWPGSAESRHPHVAGRRGGAPQQ
jgi:hypothetical protein